MSNENKTAVWWDINTCPLPDGYNPGHVRPMIESAVKRIVGSGPVTIFAVGNIRRCFSWRMNTELCSSGISIRNSHYGFVDITYEIYDWKLRNPPPANIMVITNERCADLMISFSLPYVYGRTDEEYTIIRGYASPTTLPECLWENLLQQTRRPRELMLVDKCSEESWFCRLCRFSTSDRKKFGLHLFSAEHCYNEAGVHEPGRPPRPKWAESELSNPSGDDELPNNSIGRPRHRIISSQIPERKPLPYPREDFNPSEFADKLEIFYAKKRERLLRSLGARHNSGDMVKASKKKKKKKSTTELFQSKMYADRLEAESGTRKVVKERINGGLGKRQRQDDKWEHDLFRPTMKSVVTRKTSYQAKSQQDDAEVVSFLESLGLGEYSLTFLVEEVDMDVLIHMTDKDLEDMLIPMGPRKKILLALQAKR